MDLHPHQNLFLSPDFRGGVCAFYLNSSSFLSHDSRVNNPPREKGAKLFAGFYVLLGNSYQSGIILERMAQRQGIHLFAEINQDMMGYQANCIQELPQLL